jgi:hypothetical protein
VLLKFRVDSDPGAAHGHVTAAVAWAAAATGPSRSLTGWPAAAAVAAAQAAETVMMHRDRDLARFVSPVRGVCQSQADVARRPGRHAGIFFRSQQLELASERTGSEANLKP